MKKLFYLVAAFGMLALSLSCQRENLEPAAGVVNYTVQLPETIATRADDYDGQVNQLLYEVYYKKGDAYEKLYQQEATITAGKVELPIEFVRDQKYKVLFWAQVKNNGVYETSSLTAVALQNNDDLVANSDKFEAFYGTDNVTNGNVSTKGGKVELTRAVSQLNIGTLPESLNVGKNNTVNLSKSSVIVKGLASTFNVMNEECGEIAEGAGVSYSSFAVPEGSFSVSSKDYTYVSKNYVGFAPKAATNVTVELAIETNAGTIKHIIPSVPVKPNYKTNIVGDLITASAKYNVTLSDNWSDETFDIILVNDAFSLQEAINQSPDNQETEIKLEGDIDLNDLAALLGTLSTKAGSDPVSITIPAGKIITLNLNGFNLSGVDESTANFGLITNKGSLSIVNKADKVSRILLKATNDRDWNAYSSVISTQPGSTLTVGAGVEIEHLGGTDMAYAVDILTNGKGTSVEAVIDGATLKSTYRPVRQFLNGIEATNNLTVKEGSVIKSMNGNKAIWMQDPSANANTGSLVVEEGAEVYGNVYLSVTAGSTEWPVSVSVAASALKGESVVETNSNVPVGYSLENKDGVYTVEFHPVAMIGEKGYATLNAAVAAVPDGGTITLVADETFTETNRYNNGGWWDGLGYSGDKSFTIDLGGFTISQDGALNDYLMWFKNDGAKDNTITLKNGTMDAGTSAYCALATSSSNAKKITINFEDINLINDNVNGAVLKIRAGAEVNIKDGTVITGKNSYTGIEAVGSKTVVNIYDGAKIYQKGTSSTWGFLVGASWGATVNVYGGEGVSARAAFVAMTSGGTINIFGGDWTANNDGSIGNNSNVYVLTAQNNKYESGYAGASIINVTGGTFRGGMDAWILNDVNVEKAELNISGGNFNADPSKYVAEGYEAIEKDNAWIVDVKTVKTWADFIAELDANKTEIKLGADITYDANYLLQKDVTIDLNGKSMTLPMINIHTKTTIKNGTIYGMVYARKNSDIVFDNVKFSGAVSDNLSTEGHLAIQSGCKLYAKDCLFSPTSVSGSQTKPISFEGGSSTMKFENCEFKSSPYKKQVYFNSLSATATLDFTNCNFNNKTPNIMFAAACPLTNLTMSGTTKLSSVTLEINRAKDAVTDADLAYLRELIANNSFSSVRLFYAGGSNEYIR